MIISDHSIPISINLNAERAKRLKTKKISILDERDLFGMFNDLQGFKRESHKRHKSDRRLDNNLYKFHKKSRNEKIKKLKKLDKHAKLKLEAKVEAKIEEDHEKDKIKKEHIKSKKKHNF